MKVLQVIPTLERGGAERVLLNMTDALQKAGIDVRIITIRPTNEYSNLSSSFQIQNIPSQVSYSILGKDIFQTAELNRFIEDYKPDVIHSHLLEAEFATRHFIYPNIKYVSHWHGCPEMLRKPDFSQLLKKDKWWNIYSKRRLLENYRICNNHFICVSDYIKEFVENDLGMEPSQCTVVNNPIDTQRFYPTGSSNNTKILKLITVGKLNLNKNQKFILKVVKRLVDLGINTELTIVGDGDQMDSLRSFSNSLSISDRVKFVGSVEDPETYINQSDILLHASIFEAFGLVLIEAMACGKPVVCVDRGGQGEIVRNEYNGFKTKPDDVNAFVEAIVRLRNDKQLYNQISINALEYSSEFGLEAYGATIIDFYQRLTNPAI